MGMQWGEIFGPTDADDIPSYLALLKYVRDYDWLKSLIDASL